MNPEGALLAVTIPIACVGGLFIGSFLNVVIYRVPLGLSVASPRSFCPSCHRQLSWWENIPVVSWIALHAHCRTCGQPVSARYPLVDLTTGASFGLLTWGWRGDILSVAYCLLAATMIAIALIEYGGKRSPLSIAAIGAGLAEVVILAGASYMSDWQILVGSLVGAVVAFFLYLLLRASDPDCDDPRAFGRSALLVVGCWVGGLGTTAIAWAIGTWIAVYFFCMLGSWITLGARVRAGGPLDREMHPVPVLQVPLVTAFGAAMIVSILIGL
jgi:prepilin signal peptidase PulO-like enzyme (type II secretory pathway)